MDRFDAERPGHPPNTKAGEAINYLSPRTTNIRRVFTDHSTTPVTFRAGSNHGASIVKLKPLR
jgi:virginiamycin B lyase